MIDHGHVGHEAGVRELISGEFWASTRIRRTTAFWLERSLMCLWLYGGILACINSTSLLPQLLLPYLLPSLCFFLFSLNSALRFAFNIPPVSLSLLP